MSSNEAEADGKPSLVVTGSSAGGIDALIAFVSALPPDFPAAIVIAQHLAPGHASRLEQILAKKTTLAVRTVDERDELRPGTVYLVGPDRDVDIRDERATALLIARRGPKPSIDRLFTTAAETYGERLIAIIFSGMGSDGVAGARVVKEHGGTVIIQEPSTAPFPAMPLAIPPTLVDLNARPEEMPAILADLARGSEILRGTSEQNVLRALLAQVRERSGIDFAQYKMPTIRRRLARLMVAAQVESIDEYLRYLKANPAEFQKLINAFLIKVTEFFRDAPLFDRLRAVVLPKLIDEARANGNELRIWSAGTSTGEEAYSLAILCAELLREEIDTFTVRIFATDLDANAIAFARRGVYSNASLRHVPEGWVERYFVRVGESYEVGKRIRNMTVFGQHDLGQRAPFPRIDLCLCRNVLIYFTRELQSRALQLFAFSLRSGGMLVLGKAESVGTMTEYFRVDDSTLKIFERIGERITIPPTRHVEMTFDARKPLERTTAVPPGAAAFGGSAARPNATALFGAVMSSSPMGIVVVDRRYDILAINAAARAFLEIHGVGIGEDLIHSVRTLEPAQLRSRIDAALQGDAGDPVEMRLQGVAGEFERSLQVGAVYQPAADGHGECVGLFLVDISASVGRQSTLESTSTEQRARIGALTTQVGDLLRRQKALLSANDGLVDANAELRSLNEQLLVDSEESASSNEEIETLNEEMQATNEELETLNEELQATVEELNTTNDELEARGGELEAAAKARTAELERLETELRAVGTALERVAGPYALVLGENDVVYASAAIGGRDGVTRQPPGWWRGGTLAVDGRTYGIRTEPLDGTAFTVVLLTSP